MKIKNNNGITLIALVITIIVLLILAGISINTLVGDNGILKQAQNAKLKTDEAKLEEQRQMTIAEANMNFENELYTDKNGETATIPAGFAVSQVEGENTIDDGLVIIDKVGNEFVWIEVPKTGEIYKESGLNIHDFSNDEFIKIYNDLKNYTKTYANINYEDNFYNGCGFLTQNEYNYQKNKILKSIYLDEGFWLGRYETGIEENRISNVEINDLKIFSKRNLYPINYVTCSQANILAQTFMKQSSNYSSTLILGLQFDLALKYLEQYGMDIDKLCVNSKGWGNYYDSSFKIDRGKYAQYNQLNVWYSYNQNLPNSVINGEKISVENKVNSILLTTGACEKNKKSNIYDLSGNVWEWTLEKNLNDRPIYRGGGYNDKGILNISTRMGHDLNGNNHNIGFRLALYRNY